MSRSDSSVTKGFFTFAGRKELPPHSVFKIDFQEILKKKSLGTEEQMKILLAYCDGGEKCYN